MGKNDIEIYKFGSMKGYAADLNQTGWRVC